MMMKRNGGFIQIILILVLVAVAIGGAYYFGTLKNKTNLSQAIPTQVPIATQPSIGDLANWKTYTYNQYSIKLPTSWDVDKNSTVRFITSRQTDKKGGGDFTPGFAEIYITSSANSESDWGGLELQKSKALQIGNMLAEQRSGYDGVAGSVFVIKTLLKTTDGRSYVITMDTQDQDLKSTFVSEYDQILSTFKFTDNQKSLITKEAAIQAVNDLPEVKSYFSNVKNARIVVDETNISGTYWSVHVFESLPDHNATLHWYKVDKTTGAVTKQI